MRIAVLKETKQHEYRVGMTPTCVATYVEHGHQVLVETEAGLGTGFSDQDYQAAGASIAKDAPSAAAETDMIVKVKEPSAAEVAMMHPGQILYTYLHLAALPELTQQLCEAGVVAIAYETIATPDGALPCLKPMSEIAGRLSVQEGAKYLERPFGGRGVLLGGVPGIRRGSVGIIGGGIVGTNAAKIATGMGADVTILDVSTDRLAYLDDIFGSRITTLTSDPANIREVLAESDVLIGAVLLPGRAAPKLVKHQDLSLMKPGAVIVDVAIDQGGCVETSKPTSHDDPVHIVDGIVHYGVTNMPGVVALSSTMALTSLTRRYGLALAEHGWEKAMEIEPDLQGGLNVVGGKVVHAGVAESLGI